MDTERKLDIAYPSPPGNRWRRLVWAENAPVRSASGKAVLKSLAVHADASGVAWPALGKLAAWNSRMHPPKAAGVGRPALSDERVLGRIGLGREPAYAA